MDDWTLNRISHHPQGLPADALPTPRQQLEPPAPTHAETLGSPLCAPVEGLVFLNAALPGAACSLGPLPRPSPFAAPLAAAATGAPAGCEGSQMDAAFREATNSLTSDASFQPLLAATLSMLLPGREAGEAAAGGGMGPSATEALHMPLRGSVAGAQSGAILDGSTASDMGPGALVGAAMSWAGGRCCLAVAAHFQPKLQQPELQAGSWGKVFAHVAPPGMHPWEPQPPPLSLPVPAAAPAAPMLAAPPVVALLLPEGLKQGTSSSKCSAVAGQGTCSLLGPDWDGLAVECDDDSIDPAMEESALSYQGWGVPGMGDELLALPEAMPALQGNECISSDDMSSLECLERRTGSPCGDVCLTPPASKWSKVATGTAAAKASDELDSERLVSTSIGIPMLLPPPPSVASGLPTSLQRIGSGTGALPPLSAPLPRLTSSKPDVAVPAKRPWDEGTVGAASAPAAAAPAPAGQSKAAVGRGHRWRAGPSLAKPSPGPGAVLSVGPASPTAGPDPHLMQCSEHERAESQGCPASGPCSGARAGQEGKAGEQATGEDVEAAAQSRATGGDSHLDSREGPSPAGAEAAAEWPSAGPTKPGKSAAAIGAGTAASMLPHEGSFLGEAGSGELGPSAGEAAAATVAEKVAEDDAPTVEFRLPPAGGGAPQPTRCRFLFQKELTRSDTSALGRIVLPRESVEEHFPHMASPAGQPITFLGSDGGQHTMTLKFWLNGRPSKRMYILDKVRTFCQAKQLHRGSFIAFYATAVGHYVVDTASLQSRTI